MEFHFFLKKIHLCFSYIDLDFSGRYIDLSAVGVAQDKMCHKLVLSIYKQV